MTPEEFYARPLVQRLREIFGTPGPPAEVTERQFDDAQDDLIRLARKQWHEVGREDHWCYLMDMAYMPLQQDLFEHIFPAFLIAWWEGQRSGMGGPEAENDFYYAIDQGQVLQTMLREERRREEVYDWMALAYLDGVERWAGHLSLARGSDLPNRLDGPLWSFHALGQSVPVIRRILGRLDVVNHPGIAQWWLVLGMGIGWNGRACVKYGEWAPEGGGGVFLLQSEASIFGHGYLPENHAAIRDWLTFDRLLEQLAAARPYLAGTPAAEWLACTIARLESDRLRFAGRLAEFIECLTQPDLAAYQSTLDD